MAEENPQTPLPVDRTGCDDDRAELFIRLLAENERRLTAYVMALLPHAGVEASRSIALMSQWRTPGEDDGTTKGTNHAKRKRTTDITDEHG